MYRYVRRAYVNPCVYRTHKLLLLLMMMIVVVVVVIIYLYVCVFNSVLSISQTVIALLGIHSPNKHLHAIPL